MNNYIIVTDKNYMDIMQAEYDDLVERISDYLDIRTGDKDLYYDIEDFMSKLVSDIKGLKNRLAAVGIYECISKFKKISLDELMAEDKYKLEFVKDLRASLISWVNKLQA